MDNEIEDIKRRAGIISEQESSPQEIFINHLEDETTFIRKIGDILGQNMAPDRARHILRILSSRMRALDSMKQKLQSQSQKQNQNQQMKNYQDAEQEKAGGPRRPQQ